MALALTRAADAHRSFRVDVFHDERSAAFAALGSGLASGRPAIVLCTSGTAAAHLGAAVIEADLSSVPLIVCTADRPPELRDVGAPQTIDQTKMYGDAVRWFHDPGVPSVDTAGTWRSLAARTYWVSTGNQPGPVHLNLPFREPLVGRPIAHLVDPVSKEVMRSTRERRRGRLELAAEEIDSLAGELDGRRGVIIAGHGCGDANTVDVLASSLGWPVFAEPRAGCGGGSHSILHFDALLRVDKIGETLRPEIVLRVGDAPASKVLSQWVTASKCRQIHVNATGRFFDPDHRSALRIEADPQALFEALAARAQAVSPASWWDRWWAAELQARAVLTRFDGATREWSGPRIARGVATGIPHGAHLVIASSMPIRDIEWFGGDLSHLTVHANRGANGIDGVIATGIGVARTSGAATFVLLGDVAAIHDASSLLSLAGRDADVRILLVDNDGGGIFHHLPQASLVEPETFELLYGTPHGIDFSRIGAALGVPTASIIVGDDDLESAMSVPGPSLIVIRTDRNRDVEVHKELHEQIAGALRS